MRIVIAHKYMFRGGGTATYLFALMEELRARGHEIVPFTVAYEPTVTTEWKEFYVSPPAGARSVHLRDVAGLPWKAPALLARAIWSREAYRKAQGLAKAAQPDVAYVHNLYNYMSPSPIVAFHRAGLPVVMRVPDMNMVCPGLTAIREGRACLDCLDKGLGLALKYRCHKGSLASTLARVVSMTAHRWLRVYDAVDLFVTPSEFMRRVLLRWGLAEERVVHLPSFYRPRATEVTDKGLEEGPEAGRHAEGAGKEAEERAVERPYVLYFGRVAREKGLEVLIRAARLLGDEVEVRIAGGDRDGERARLEALVTELGLKQVHFLGHQQQEALETLIDGAAFTVVPSLWYDNCPMAVLESFAHGKPVIGARIGGIPEQITPEAGLLFEPGDAEDLANKMRILLLDEDLRRRMGEAARKRLRRVYSPEAHCQRLLELFDELIAGRSPAGGPAGTGAETKEE